MKPQMILSKPVSAWEQIMEKDDVSLVKAWLPLFSNDTPLFKAVENHQAMIDLMVMGLKFNSPQCLKACWERLTMNHLASPGPGVFRSVLSLVSTQSPTHQKALDQMHNLLSCIPHRSTVTHMKNARSMMLFCFSSNMPELIFHPVFQQDQLQQDWLFWSHVQQCEFYSPQHTQVARKFIQHLTPQQVFDGLMSSNEYHSGSAYFLASDDGQSSFLNHLLARDLDFWLQLDGLLKQDPAVLEFIRTLVPYDDVLLQKDLSSRLGALQKPSSGPRLL